MQKTWHVQAPLFVHTSYAESHLATCRVCRTEIPAYSPTMLRVARIDREAQHGLGYAVCSSECAKADYDAAQAEGFVLAD